MPRLCAALPPAQFAVTTYQATGTLLNDGPLYVLIVLLLLNAVGFVALLAARWRAIQSRKADNQTASFWMRFRGPEVALGFEPDTSWVSVWIARLIPFIAGLCLWAFAIWLPLAVGVLGAAATLLIGLSLFIPFGSLTVYLSEQKRFPFLTVLWGAALAFALLDFADNHRIRACNGREECTPALDRNKADAA